SAIGFTWSLGWLPAEKALNRPSPSRRRMLSAMIERAEFPVHRNSTLKTRSGIFGHLVGIAAVIRSYRRESADFRPAAAAIAREVKHEVAEAAEVGAVDDRAAVAPPRDETGTGQHRQVGRHGVLWHARPSGHV